LQPLRERRAHPPLTVDRRRVPQFFEFAKERHLQRGECGGLSLNRNHSQTRTAKGKERGGGLRWRHRDAHRRPAHGRAQLLANFARRAKQPREPGEIEHHERPDNLIAGREILRHFHDIGLRRARRIETRKHNDL
jgi:hypothetical protein